VSYRMSDARDAVAQPPTERAFEELLRHEFPAAKAIAVDSRVAMTGGYSRVMTLFTATVDGHAMRFVTRGDPPAGQSVVRTDRDREWRLLAALTADAGALAPAARFYDDGTYLGTKTIVMDFVDGGSFLARIRDRGPDELAPEADTLCDLAAAIHSTDLDVLPPEFSRPTDWNTYIDSVIELWRRTEREHVESDPFLRYLATWLDHNRPPAAPLALVHGDFQTSNMILDGAGGLVAADWEFARIGDPREDLGWCKWVGSTVIPPDLVGHDEQAFCDRYCRLSGLGADVVNPDTLTYFSVLSAINVVSQILAGQRAFICGANDNISSAYVVAATVSKHESWMRSVRILESAKSRLGAST
jgi:aminoglycoside phosphotransferase (APT) family kinase protein